MIMMMEIHHNQLIVSVFFIVMDNKIVYCPIPGTCVKEYKKNEKAPS